MPTATYVTPVATWPRRAARSTDHPRTALSRNINRFIRSREHHFRTWRPWPRLVGSTEPMLQPTPCQKRVGSQKHSTRCIASARYGELSGTLPTEAEPPAPCGNSTHTRCKGYYSPRDLPLAARSLSSKAKIHAPGSDGPVGVPRSIGTTGRRGWLLKRFHERGDRRVRIDSEAVSERAAAVVAGLNRVDHSCSVYPSTPSPRPGGGRRSC